MKRAPSSAPGGRGLPRGYSFLELLLALALGSVILLGMLSLWSAARSGLNSHQSALDTQWQAQRALGFMASELRRSGYHPQPWSATVVPPLLADSSNSADGRDELSLQRLSRSDCHGNPLDAADRSRYGRLQMRFSIDPSQSRLHWRCQWQADGGSSVLQVNNQTLADQVEALAVLYAEDTDGDQLADSWIPAGAWQDLSQVRRLHIGLLLREQKASTASRSLMLLDEQHGPWTDPLPRRVFETHVALRNAQADS